MRTTRINVSIVLPTVIVEWAVCLVLIYRKMRYGYKYRRIQLTRGKYAIVDPGDYEWLMQFKWHTNCGRGKFYAANSRSQKMHRLIMFGVKEEYRRQNTLRLRSGQALRLGSILLTTGRSGRAKLFVDHINGDGLDNRRANLRLATPAQNNWNSKSGMGRGASRYKGVQWHKHRKKWVVVIGVNGRKEHIGYFGDEKEAARAYDKAAKERHGEYAVLNFSST